MTEKKYFCLKTFFVIKYFRFSFIFYVKIATPLPKKIHPPLSQQPPIKADGGGQNLPFWKFGWRLNLPAEERAQNGSNVFCFCF